VTIVLLRPAHAVEPGQDTTELEKLSLGALLNPIVTTATKSVLTLEETPSIVTVFQREDIERRGARQLMDLLRFVPGFFEVSSQPESNVAIRGIHASSPYHFVVLLDGLPMNDFLFSSSGPDGFSLEGIERVEVIRGPGSAIYGASALMGVVNLITQRPEAGGHGHARLTAGGDGEWRGDVSFSSSSRENQGFFGAASFWLQGGTPLAAPPTQDVLIPTLGQNISDGIQAGENLTAPRHGATADVGGYGPSFNTFLKYQHDPTLTLRLFISRSQRLLQRTYRDALFTAEPSTQTPYFINERVALDMEKRWGAATERGQVTFRPSALLFGHELRSQVVAPMFYAAASREGVPAVYGWSGRDVRTGASLEYSVQLPDLGFLRRTSVVAGAQSEYNIATDYHTTSCFVDDGARFPPSIYTGAPSGGSDLFCLESLMLREGLTVDRLGAITGMNGGGWGDGDELRLGAFAQLSTFLPGKIGVVMGGRLDYNFTYRPQLSPRVALVAPIGRGFYAKAQFSSAFVYPAFLYRNGNALSEYQGNPDIAPQYVKTFEALLGLKVGDQMRAEVTFYYNDLSGFITFDPLQNARTGRYLFSNQGDLRIAGVEATTQFRFANQRLALDLHGTFARPLASTSDRFLVDGALGGPSKYPEATGMVVIGGSVTADLELMVDASFSTRVKQSIAPEIRYDGVPGTDGQPYATEPASGFETRDFTLGVRAMYTLPWRFELEASATNLLDRRAHRPGSVLMPYSVEGRRIRLALSYRF
jgi:outer membrane receptor protein involved in Fe transport